jgi:hypothetical protein
MSIHVFKQRETVRKLWWLHDSFWHAALVRELGSARANALNLEVGEKIFRMVTNTLLRENRIQRPKTIQDLMEIFKVVWKGVFFDRLYIDEPIRYSGDTAVWTGTRCHAYDSVRKAHMIREYVCGCRACRTGVMKALRLEPLHEIRESLVRGDGRCVIEVRFRPLRKT